MKFGINKFYDPLATDQKAADPAQAKDAIMKELGTIKSALEKKLNDDKDGIEKNLDDKLVEINKSIETLKAVKPEVTLEEINAIKEEAKITQKALDIMQNRVKTMSMTQQPGAGYGEDTSFGGQIVKALISKKNEIMTGKSIGRTMEEQGMMIKAVGDMTVVTNVLTTGVVPNTYRPGLIPPPFENIHMRNLVTVTPSETDSYHFYRFSQGEGNIAFQAGENNTKAQIDEDLNEQVVNLDYLAGWLKISRKMLRNFTALQAFLSRWLPEQYYQTEDTKAYVSLIAQSTGVQDTSITGGFIQMIVRTIGKQKKARYNVNGIVVDGEVWANMLTYKASGSGEFTMPIGIVTVTATGQVMICGIPVYTASWVGGDEAIIGDWRYFEIIQSESLSVGFFEQDDKNVQQNKITARVEASVGFAMLDPKAFVVVSLESAS